ncbi:MAG: hypothetical protein ACRDQ5_12925 [Sciscionella sp.]
MQLWRITAAVLLGAGGLVLVLMAMAQARESRGGTNTRVAVTGLVSFGVAALLTALVATVLPAAQAWVITGLVLLTVFALANAS